MKKLIQVFSFLSLVVVFSIVSANAQTIKQYAAEVPFDFNIGQKSYQAGSYVIKISKHSQSSLVLSLEDKNKNLLQSILVRGNGDVSKNETRLIFTHHDNQRVLTKMMTPDMGVTVLANDAARNSKAKALPAGRAQGVAVAAKN